LVKTIKTIKFKYNFMQYVFFDKGNAQCTTGFEAKLVTVI